MRLQKNAPKHTGRWRLVVISEEGSASHALPEKGDVTLGRGDDCQIRLDDLAASRRHATLHLGETVVLEDLGSANGTTVRGRKLTAKESVELGAGDGIELGQTLAVLQPDELWAAPRPWTLHTHARFVELIGKAKAPFAVIRLHVQATPGTVQDVLVQTLSKDDDVASFGKGQFEVLARDRDAARAQSLMEQLSAKLVAAGARVRAGLGASGRDGATPEELLAACSQQRAQVASGFVVHDDAMAALYRVVDKVAPSNINVLLLGETGVGKEVLAAEIHRRSKRASGPFLKLNCGAFTETLVESELFGHVKGSFTGAQKDKPGLLESAKGGTVFLDELGELPAGIQPKLLRALEERKVMKVGSNTPDPIDVRLIFATNRDLEAEVSRGAFRQDLYYRVNGVQLEIPPLRERMSELEPLAASFAQAFAEKEKRAVPQFSPEAIAALKAHSWPGNIRELRNAVEKAVLMVGDGPITAAALGLEKHAPSAPVSSGAGGSAEGGLAEERSAAEKRKVLEVLEQTKGNQTEAAKILKISRRTLVSRLQEYGMTRPRKK
ncbi:MAG: sigma 54-interacting transcriptional regulator [Myxococcaceae bacterium]